MDFINDLVNSLSGVPFDLVFQLTCLALIVLAGPIVVALLAFRGGDL